MQGEKTTGLQVGAISARCPACGAKEFVAPPEAATGLVCASCGKETPRRVLMDGVARDAIARADEVLRARREPP
jgi:transcription initiation factor TFIIIB Brf1 subunit/transcription initiation factor TFIIB